MGRVTVAGTGSVQTMTASSRDLGGVDMDRRGAGEMHIPEGYPSLAPGQATRAQVSVDAARGLPERCPP